VKKRIAYVSHQTDFFFAHYGALPRLARDAGFETWLIGPREVGAERGRVDGFEEIAGVVTAGYAQRLANLPRLTRALARVAPNVVHSVSIQSAVLVALARKLCRVRFKKVDTISGLGHTFSAKGGKIQLLQAAIGKVLSVASMPGDALMFQNQDDMDALLRHASNFRGNVSIVPGVGVDLERFVPPHSPSARRYVAFLGRLTVQKGALDFLRVAQRLVEAGVVAGSDVVMAGTNATANPTALSLAVFDHAQRDGFVGHVGPVDHVPSMLASTLVLVFPSVREGFSKAIMEAMACGVPIVGYDVPGVRAQVIHEVTGLLVPFGDVDALTSAVRRVLTDRALRDRLGGAARHHALAEFDERRLSDRIFRCSVGGG
jgi:glycosyltransferase involved in cell wall biosynthesis